VTTSRTVVVALPSGAGVVRVDRGLLVTEEVGDGGGTYLNEADPFQPVKTWVDESRSVVGGVLPPGAVSAEAVDDRGARVAAVVGGGAYAAILEQPNDGHEAIVCCRDASGTPVRRPWAADYPSVHVTDATEPCPGCGAVDWDEYTPHEEWRGGRGSKVDGTHVANPVVSCRVCGHEEREGSFFAVGSEPDASEDEAARAARLARARAHERKQRWLTNKLTLRATEFPIYAAEAWPAQLVGNGSQGDELTEITIYHYDRPDADALAGDRPRLAITTKRNHRYSSDALTEAREALDHWIRRDAGGASWPDASHAAITLWLRARARESRGAALSATRSEPLITIDGAPTRALMLSGPGGRWVAVADHADLMIAVVGQDAELASLRLEPIADPAAHLLGPEPPDA
jgi:hypothetical protein